ncbi:MAG TPA: metallophosphoesterase [Candidatus Hydrogenedentes bacterium]|nr:metallophosphoesterase [Candidatus Hydrogenedentota bacterium]
MMRILHISDLHFWTITCNPFYLLNKRLIGNLNLVTCRRRHIRQERAGSFIELMKGLCPDVVLVGGDLTTTALDSEYEKASGFLSRLQTVCPDIYVIPGNHDYYTFESQRKGRFEKYLGRYNPLSDPFVSYHSINDIALVCLSTVRPNLFSSRGFISKPHRDAAQKILWELQEQQVIVLAHYPCLYTTPEYHTGLTRRLEGALPLREMLGGVGRSILYLAGHVHVFSHGCDPVYANVTQVTTAPLFYEKNKQPGGFTEIVTDKDELKIFPWTYDEGWTRCRESLPAPA